VDNSAFVTWAVGPTQQLEVQGRIAEGAKSHTCSRFLRNQWIVTSRFEQELTQPELAAKKSFNKGRITLMLNHAITPSKNEADKLELFFGSPTEVLLHRI